MSASVTLTCDCGCMATVTDVQRSGWFVLTQPDRRPRGHDDPKLEHDLHFSTLACLQCWSSKAVEVVPALQKSVRGLYPRGMTRHPEVEGLFI